MKFTIQLLIEDPSALPLCVSIQTIERSCERVEDVGLRLEEAKTILGNMQQQMGGAQITAYLEQHRACEHCGRARSVKGYHSIRFRTAFGDLALRSPRWNQCACNDRASPVSFSPLARLLTTHTAPELEYLQAKWAAHRSFAAVSRLLHDVLPIDAGLHG
jgi:hypothetical protein